MDRFLMRKMTPLVLMGLLIFSIGIACSVSIPSSSSQVPSITQVVVTAIVQPVAQPILPAVITNEEQVLIDLYERANPAVVNITVYITQNNQVLPASQGSGFVFDTQGNIVTNAHVIQGAEQIEVVFSEGTIKVAEIVGEDLHSDLAVLHVAEQPANVIPLSLGNMESLRVGQTVVAIGNPFGLQGTLTRGIISALGRNIPGLSIFTIPQSIQTDAAINPGNSGGPLLNLSGDVIGVNAQIETGGTSISNSGVGFAIPVSIIQRVVPGLIENGEFSWSWLGVRGSDVNPSLVKAMDLPVEKGAYIWQVTDGGPSADAGLRGFSSSVNVDGRQVDTGGDVITAVNGQPVYSFDDLLLYVTLQTSPGDTVILTVVRDGKYKDIEVTLAPRPTGN
jgi:S1-C subfamily serine protease